MTGTAVTSAEEFHKVYGLEVLVIPTNKPLIRKDMPDRVYKTDEAKFRAVVKEIKERHQKGEPVLCGTTSIQKNEYLHHLLEMEGIPHEVLNAKNHAREGEIIAQAGRKGAVTIATNMAGRGVDIVLGGNPATGELSEEVKNLGGLHVIGTERHEARRIDNQLRGRTGRQGDPGSSQIYVSLEDDLMRIFGGDRIKNIMTKFNLPEDQPIETGMVSSALESAQSKIEGMNFDARKHLLEYDDVLNKHREIFYRKRKEILEMAQKDTLSIYILEITKNHGHTEQEYEKKKQEFGEENMKQAEKGVALKVMDSLWIDHLETMEALRDSVRLRAYGQQDPLVEYKNEGRKAFENLISSIDALIAQSMFTVQITPHQHSQPQVVAPRNKDKVGRNEPCPCGSGKKYKKCHGK